MRPLFLLLALLFMACSYSAQAGIYIKPETKTMEWNQSEEEGLHKKEWKKQQKRQHKKARRQYRKQVKKQLKAQLKEWRQGNDTDLLLLVIIAILLPPLAMFLYDGLSNRFWISLLLTLLFYVPGLVYTLIVILGEN